MIDDIFQSLEKDYEEYQKIEQQLHLLDNNINTQIQLQLSKKYHSLKKKLNDYILYKNIKQELNDTLSLFHHETCDAELKYLAINEIQTLKKKLTNIEEKLKHSILPTNNNNNEKETIFFEIRAASGGNEASIFVEDLLKMYINFFNNKKWHYEIITSTKGNISGYKELILKINGINVTTILQNEAGIHRVQRVPITDAHGKIQTSTCSIAVLPDVTNINDIDINPNEIRIDTFRASGAGGQHVNMTDSAVRIIHIPTNTVVECQNERSQHKNKHTALTLLKSRLLIKKQNEQKNIIDNTRKNMVGTGNRSEKIRTYNYIKNRITNHKDNITSYRLKEIMEGNLNIILNKTTNI